MMIFNFKDKIDSGSWFPINDGIMGGVSEGKILMDSAGLIFSGFLSFKNNGGFSSVRSEDKLFDLRSFTGIGIEAAGDGKVYKLNVRNNGISSSINFQQRFQPKEKFQKYFLPFENFSANRRGREISSVKLDPLKIISFGFLISDKQEGEFKITVKSIFAY